MSDDDATCNKIPSSLDCGDEILEAMQGIIRYRKRVAKDLDFVKITARYSEQVQESFEEAVEAASEDDKIPLTNDDFLAWSRAMRNREDARGTELIGDGEGLVHMCYLAWMTAIMLLHIPDWTRLKCSELSEKADILRERDDEDDEDAEDAEEMDEIREEFEGYADECENWCDGAAGNLREALEKGDLTKAVEAIEDGDFFLDIGA